MVKRSGGITLKRIELQEVLLEKGSNLGGYHLQKGLGELGGQTSKVKFFEGLDFCPLREVAFERKCICYSRSWPEKFAQRVLSLHALAVSSSRSANRPATLQIRFT